MLWSHSNPGEFNIHSKQCIIQCIIIPTIIPTMYNNVGITFIQQPSSPVMFVQTGRYLSQSSVILMHSSIMASMIILLLTQGKRVNPVGLWRSKHHSGRHQYGCFIRSSESQTFISAVVTLIAAITVCPGVLSLIKLQKNCQHLYARWDWYQQQPNVLGGEKSSCH